MARVTVERIEEVTRRALARHGAAAGAAAQVADAVAVAEAQGNRICGLAYLESYCRQLQSGRVEGDVVPEVSRLRPGVVAVDAKLGFAQPAFTAGLPLALEAARQCGVASLAVRHAHTCTSLGYFTARIARAGMIGIGFTNASPVVAPPGGRRRVIGTNPISFAVPDGAGGLALLVDQSTTAVALGKIKLAKAAGEAIPEGWAVDAEGRPTTDPARALEGSLMSLGGIGSGYKGWGFGLMAEVLAAGMAGGVLSRDVAPLLAPEGAPHDLGQYYLLIDPGASDVFGARMAALAEAVAEDAAGRLPGRDKRGASEVEVPDALWALAEGLAVGPGA
ncbi:MAG: Ldh family oxidoreductase [Paracoccaceae bacterium]